MLLTEQEEWIIYMKLKNSVHQMAKANPHGSYWVDGDCQDILNDSVNLANQGQVSCQQEQPRQ